MNFKAGPEVSFVLTAEWSPLARSMALATGPSTEARNCFVKMKKCREIIESAFCISLNSSFAQLCNIGMV